MNKRICPLMKCECLEQKCAWWTKDYETCTVSSIGEYLDTMAFMFEKIEKMVLNDD